MQKRMSGLTKTIKEKKVLRLLIPNKSPLWKHSFYSHIVHDPIGKALRNRIHWAENFSCHFPNFQKRYNRSPLYFHPNWKSIHPTVQPLRATVPASKSVTVIEWAVMVNMTAALATCYLLLSLSGQNVRYNSHFVTVCFFVYQLIMCQSSKTSQGPAKPSQSSVVGKVTVTPLLSYCSV
jgi:hypothetical protein